MNHWIKKGLWVAIFALLGTLLSDFCHKQTKGFSMNKIALALPPQMAEMRPISTEIDSALDQPFSYLKKGNSAFVFISQDNRYILKFARAPNITPPFWATWKWTSFFLPNYTQDVIMRKKQEKDRVLTSYQLASQDLKDQSGILYAHIHQTCSLKKQLTLYDNIKVKLEIPADRTLFILQKKADPFYPYFKKLIKTNQNEKAKQLIQEFAFLLLDRAQKGIYDKDLSPQYNLGIFEGHFMTFDLDRLKKDKVPSSAEEIQNHMLQDGKKMILLLERTSTDLALFFKEEIQRLSCLKDPLALESMKKEDP